LLAFPGVPRIFPADAALGLSARIIGEKNTAVNRIFGRLLSAKRYSLTNPDPETIHISHLIFSQNFAVFHGGVEQVLHSSKMFIPVILSVAPQDIQPI
jgi:hypothetical protein